MLSIMASSPAVFLSAPSASLFKFPPDREPQTLPPPPPGSTLSAPPFAIPASLFNSALDFKVPVLVASIYAVSVTLLNAYNRSRGNKPWAVSKTRSFFWFVVAHNVFLAVYSGWTFVGMLGALQRTVQNPAGRFGLVGTVDSLCKMHGTAGLGNAIVYDTELSQWISESPSKVLLTDMGTPHTTDLGRLWNEGLAFYGWFFYLSKFYEVLDTVIILAKGKKSSTLQTYHHAGAMMCMWAGIRFMSAPIYIFVVLNSLVHALMVGCVLLFADNANVSQYTYYTLTAFAVPIPQVLKRNLTTMQILQFIFGASYAAVHLFVSYTVPVQVLDVKSSAASLASAASTAASSVAASASSVSVATFLKKLLFRAAGEEGLAESVNAPSALHMVSPRASHSGGQYRIEYQTVPCIDTSGQTFAVWLNLFYLAPLTVLFVRFFIRSYIKRTSVKGPSDRGVAENAGRDAIKGVEKELYRNGGVNGHANGKMNGQANGKINGKH
jgi:hypothetical protein